MSKQHSKFYTWWNSNYGKKIISAVYSAGASIVILGAMFKILHLPYAWLMLGVGMSTEAIIFALGVFDKPHKEFDWAQIFDFKNSEPQTLNVVGGTSSSSVSQRSTALNYSESISDDDVKKLSEGIKNLSNTAESLQTISNVAVAANSLAKNIETASEAAVNFTTTQQKLNDTTEKLSTSYLGITSDMDAAINNTKSYAEKVAEMNKSLASINSIYEIQLRHIQSQNEGLSLQAESIRNLSGKLDEIVSDLSKMKETTNISVVESQKYQSATTKLTKQVEDLNAVYGNMLNALG
ncbi:Gliding motility-associated protein GldL [uncultured Paludibacter sp.]|uniref:Gliding motility-associated protein GldL n=1 Tax=uncultured Paludibacter sp. TaxID=497635 RepID=A0A653AFW0_9BACT|nr:Gliding motility-associated protein GldL [uncultured Paludibacter sp.]